MKNFKIITTILITLGVASLTNCKKDDCVYELVSTSGACVEICSSIEDFEDDTIGSLGNWIGINARPSSSIIVKNGSNVLFADDGSGGSWIYNKSDFPTDLIGAGCELQYDIEYIAGTSNSLTTNNSITIFQGVGSTPISFNKRASFELKPTNLITSLNPPKIIIVPLEFASGTSLPSNSFGDWVMTGGAPYTAAQIADFNSLIQNNNGIGFFLDEGANPTEEWYYDNFCIKNCCP